MEDHGTMQTEILGWGGGELNSTIFACSWNEACPDKKKKNPSTRQNDQVLKEQKRKRFTNSGGGGESTSPKNVRGLDAGSSAVCLRREKKKSEEH